MATFTRLKIGSGRPVLVNLDLVTHIEPSGRGTDLNFDSVAGHGEEPCAVPCWLHVVETFDEVASLVGCQHAAEEGLPSCSEEG